MTRKDEIKNNSPFEELEWQQGYGIWESGAEWADAHPASPWHKTSEELPKDGELVLVSNPAIQFAKYDGCSGCFHPALRVGHKFMADESRMYDHVCCWMKIPLPIREDR